MSKWTLEQAESGEKFHYLRRDGVLRMRLPAGCLHLGAEGGDVEMFLRILNSDNPLAALKKYGRHTPQCSLTTRGKRCDCGFRAALNDVLFVSALAEAEGGSDGD